MISASASPWAAIAAARPSASDGQALPLGRGERLDALALDLGLLQHGRDQLLLAAQDFCFLHLDLLLLLDLLHLHLLRHDLLLHDVGLDLVGLVGLRLLPLDGSLVLRLLHVEVALRLGLLGQRQRLGQHALLVGLRPWRRPPRAAPRRA